MAVSGPVTISRAQYEAGRDAASSAAWIKNSFSTQDVVDAFLAAAGVTVEKTDAERIAAFVAAARTFRSCRTHDAIWQVIDSHFPEVNHE